MKALRKMDYESNVKRIVKAIMKQGMDMFGNCVVHMSEALGQEVMANYRKYLNGIDALLSKRGWRDEDGVKWYYSVTDMHHESNVDKDEGCYCLIFYLEEEYIS